MYNLCLLISCIGSKCRELTADCGDCYPTALSHALLCRTVPWVFVESFCFAMFVESSRYYLHISSMALGEVASCSEVTGMMPCLHHQGWFLAFSSFPACMTSSSSLVPTMNLFRSMAKINFLAQIFPPRVLEFSESLTAFNLLMPVWLQENVVNVTTFQEHKQRAEDEVHGLIESINQQAVNCFVVSFFVQSKGRLSRVVLPQFFHRMKMFLPCVLAFPIPDILGLLVHNLKALGFGLLHIKVNQLNMFFKLSSSVELFVYHESSALPVTLQVAEMQA